MLPMNRRTLLFSAAALAATPARAGQFTGKIRKSLKWSMAEKAAKGMPLAGAFKKLRECGFEGVEPSLLSRHVTLENAAEWAAAAKEAGLIIDGTVGGRAAGLEEGAQAGAGLHLEQRAPVAGGDDLRGVVAELA